MDRATLMQTLRDILEEDRGEKFDSISESAKLRDDLGLDSVDMVTLVMQVQDRFRVVLGSEELQSIVTVADLLNLMQAKLAGQIQAA
jgi:acyl carrier protein